MSKLPQRLKQRQLAPAVAGILILCVLLSGASSANDAPADRKPAVLLDERNPVYPRPALYENREGWVRVDFEIDRSGKATNAFVVESVGGSIFENAAVRSVGRWRFEPAQLNGRPVAQMRNTAVVTFAMNEQARGSSRRFADRYNDILNLIDKKQLQRADALARSVFDEWPLNLYELTKLWALRAELALIQNDLLAAESALIKATANGGRWLDQDAYRSLLLAMVHVDVEIGQFRRAIESFRKLIEFEPDRSDEVWQTARMIKSLQEIISSDQTLATDGVIQRSEGCASCRDQWSFEPVRSNFNISDVEGDLASVILTCDTVRVPLPYVSNKSWLLPPHSGDCEVSVTGALGTTFRVYQLANP